MCTPSDISVYSQSYSSVLNTLRISFSLLVGFGDLGAGEQPLILHSDVPFK